MEVGASTEREGTGCHDQGCFGWQGPGFRREYVLTLWPQWCRRFAWAGLVAFTILVLVILSRYVVGSRSRPPLTAIVRFERIEDTVLASGTIQPLKLVSVGAQASGRIVRLHVALGARVV